MEQGLEKKYQLGDGLREQAVVAAIGGGGLSGALEMEVGEDLPIRQGLQKKLLRELLLCASTAIGSAGSEDRPDKNVG